MTVLKLSKPLKYYKSKDTVAKQRIVSLVYAGKLIFDKTGYRTPKPNDAIRLLHRYSKDFKGNKEGKDANFYDPSLRVVLPGLEPGPQASEARILSIILQDHLQSKN